MAGVVDKADRPGTGSIEPSNQFAYATENGTAPGVNDWRDQFEALCGQRLSDDSSKPRASGCDPLVHRLPRAVRLVIAERAGALL